MSETRSLSERGDELGRVLFEAMTLHLLGQPGVTGNELTTWDGLTQSDREWFRDVALAVAFAAVGGGAA